MNKKEEDEKAITFKGNRDKWTDFQYYAKKEGYNKIWKVLEPLVDNYIKKQKKRLEKNDKNKI